MQEVNPPALIVYLVVIFGFFKQCCCYFYQKFIITECFADNYNDCKKKLVDLSFFLNNYYVISDSLFLIYTH